MATAAPPPPYPVIFVPGIMGSELRDRYPVDSEKVWSPFKLLIRSYDRITLHPSDARFELKEPARVMPDDLFGLIYSEIIEELRHNLSPQANQPVPVFPFSYDWRQPLESAEQQLSDFVDEVIDRTKLLRHYDAAQYGKSAQFPAKVNLVAHSMGGLIVADYLGHLQSKGEDKVHKVVTIASPFRGSMDAVSQVAIGEGGLDASTSGSRKREAARVTPALYYLLPSYAGAVTATDGLSGDLFSASAWQPGILETLASFIQEYSLDQTTNPFSQAVELVQKMLDAALKHRNRMERLTLANSKMWLSIVGVGETTRVGMEISKDSGGSPWFDLSKDYILNNWTKKKPRGTKTGDNTVPYFGARASFIPLQEVVCVSPDDFGLLELKDRFMENFGFHISLPNMNLVQRLTVSHLMGKVYGKVWGRLAPDLAEGTEWTPPIAGLKPPE